VDLRERIEDPNVIGEGAEETKQYALANLETIVDKVLRLGPFQSLDVMMNGPYLLEIHVDVGPVYKVVGVGSHPRANFGGEGIHVRDAPKSECTPQ
jgi:hypothetical protein